LELKARRIQLEHLERSAAARSKALSSFLKHRAKALAAAAQRQQQAAVLCAWQRQAQRQQEAVWSWRELAQLLLRQQPAETAKPSVWCVQPARGRSLTHGQLQPEADAAAAGDKLSTDSSWEVMDGFGAITCALQGTDQICTNSGGSCSKTAGTFMQRLLQRRRDPEGSCRAAVAEEKLLAASLRAWHMMAHIESKARGIKQVGGRGC
jgi:hypothetical protein